MTTVVLVLATVAAVAVMMRVALARARASRCADCGVEPEQVAPVGHGPNQTWELWCCPSCSAAQTRVQGVPSALAWCPACQQRTLSVSAHRVPSPEQAGALRLFEVEERCGVCEFERTYRLGDGEARPLARVITFPGRARPAAGASSDAHTGPAEGTEEVTAEVVSLFPAARTPGRPRATRRDDEARPVG